MGIPLIHRHSRNSPAPSLDRSREIFSSPADIDAHDLPKEFRWVLPFIAAELPCLARGEDGHDAVPIVRFELLRGVDEDEAESAGRVDTWENPGDVQNGGGSAGGAS